jgi:hypothetical protein
MRTFKTVMMTVACMFIFVASANAAGGELSTPAVTVTDAETVTCPAVYTGTSGSVTVAFEIIGVDGVVVGNGQTVLGPGESNAPGISGVAGLFHCHFIISEKINKIRASINVRPYDNVTPLPFKADVIVLPAY